MRNYLRGLTALFTTLLMGSASAQTVYDGPYVGDPEARSVKRERDWFCDVNRIIGCSKFGHICYI